MVNRGRRFAIKIDPFWYLAMMVSLQVVPIHHATPSLPNCMSATIRCRRKSGNRVENRARRNMLRSRRLEKDDFAFPVSYIAHV